VPFWIEARAVTPRCPRTCCARPTCTSKCLPAFLREPSKAIELLAPCQILFPAYLDTIRGRSNSLLAVVPSSGEPESVDEKPIRISYFAQRKISNSDQKLPEPLGLARDQLSGLAMACSLRDSLQGFRDLAFLHLTLRTSFPLPSTGRPHGHREAPSLICNFQRLAHATLVCNSRLTLPSPPRCNFPRIAITPL
jgi:hypothetical protein